MANKTKLQRVLDEAEAAIAAKAEETKAALDEVNKTIPALEQMLRDIEDGCGPVDEIKVKIRSGEDVPPGALTQAREEEEVAALRLDGLKRRRGTLAKTFPVETTILAEKVAEVLGDVMQGFHIHTTRAPKWEWPEDSTAIVCVANNDVKRDPSTGLVSGSVTVYFRRPGLYKAIPVAALEDAATAYRFGLEVRSHEIGDDKHRGVWVKKQAYGGAEVNAYKDPHAHVVDVMKVDVRNVIDGYPVIKRVDLSHLGTAMRGITVEVYRAGNESSAVQHAPAPENSPSTWQVIEGRNILALGGHKVAVVSEKVNDEGVRTLVVQYGVGTFNTHPGDFTEGLEAVLNDRLGVTYNGCGVLVGSKVERTSDNHETRVHNYVVTLTFESKVS